MTLRAAMILTTLAAEDNDFRPAGLADHLRFNRRIGHNRRANGYIVAFTQQHHVRQSDFLALFIQLFHKDGVILGYATTVFRLFSPQRTWRSSYS